MREQAVRDGRLDANDLRSTAVDWLSPHGCWLRDFLLAIDLPGYGSARFDLALPQLKWAIEVDVHPTHRETAGLTRDGWRDEASAALGWAVTRVDPSGFGSALTSTVADPLGQRATR